MREVEELCLRLFLLLRHFLCLPLILFLRSSLPTDDRIGILHCGRRRRVSLCMLRLPVLPIAPIVAVGASPKKLASVPAESPRPRPSSSPNQEYIWVVVVGGITLEATRPGSSAPRRLQVHSSIGSLVSDTAAGLPPAIPVDVKSIIDASSGVVTSSLAE